MTPGCRWQVGRLRFPIVPARAHSLSQAASSAALHTRFPGETQKPQQTIWTTSVYGTYILRPAHLRGEEPIHFLGKAGGGTKASLIKHASVTSDQADK